MDSSGFNPTGRAVAVPLVPRHGVVFGKAAAGGGVQMGIAGAGLVTASDPGPGSGGQGGGAASRQGLRGARYSSPVQNAGSGQSFGNRKVSPGAQSYNAEVGQGFGNRKVSPGAQNFTSGIVQSVGNRKVSGIAQSYNAEIEQGFGTRKVSPGAQSYNVEIGQGFGNRRVSPSAQNFSVENGQSVGNRKANPGAQIYNADIGQNMGSRKVSPTRTRRPAQVVAQPSVLQSSGGSTFTDAEQQREENAKAQRLLRFQRNSETGPQRVSVKGEPRFPAREARQPGQPRAEASKPQLPANSQDDTMESEGTATVGEDFIGTEAIVGTCNDMCSETERHERERKGDLDKFERVDGDRNLTSVDLAVKKYTRTPSRDPHMIRPLPVLQMTMNYLLSLIDRDYGEGLLSLHSFLWDRMRAVRMDLRMQHIFNREAITMHEQMIRFHILAMHELCQFKKGEGFNEGFDAHLNIEQMNKASVDLFEMYDDHRKRGIQVETEAEFRGYYALLKLDKHPGYSVEPAELSLDLAKMTSEMRNTPQVLFARDVARACRGGNYIAFFRLARKATYLQACLMHAHFAKLRTGALASLHSGLQKNQGVPIVQVVKWLGMEGEDIETLVEYHGFSLKQFEKLYAVKDGPFLNRDAEYQARRSRLVEAKHSSTVVLDVEGKGQEQAVVDIWAASQMTPVIQEEEMPDYEEEDLPSLLETSQTSPVQEYWTPTPGRSSPGVGQGADDMRISPPYKAISPPKGGQTVAVSNGFSPKALSLWPTPIQLSIVPSPFKASLSPQRSRKRESYPGRLTQEFDLKEGNKKLVTAVGPIDVEPEEEEEDDLPDTGPTSEEIRAKKVLEWEVEKEAEREKERERQRRKRATEEAEAAAAKWAAKLAADAELKRQLEEEKRLATYRTEASAGKKRLWLRRWKRRAAIMAEEKLRRRIRAEAALSSLSVGPPLADPKSDTEQALIVGSTDGSARISIDQVARERAERIIEMWKPLNVASLVLPLFEHKYPTSKFITFKLLLSVGSTDVSNMAGQWLSSKLAASQLVLPEVHSDGRTPGFWFQAMHIDERLQSQRENALYGASGLVFLVIQGRSITEERARLHSLVETLPVGGRLPLLLLYTPQERNIEAETEKLKTALGLTDFEGLRIGWQNVSPVSSSFDGGLYSDGFLCGGLVWLANSTSSQPNLRPIHVRELVTSNLDGHCKLLLATSPSNVTPDRCVSIFNRSVRSAAIEIRKAVGTAPPHWPPPEAQLEVTDVLPGILPQQGWSEPDVLDPILHALRVAELPRFPTLEQLRPGSPTSAWESVRYQKATVEKALQQYLARIDGTRDDDPVIIRQAQVMVQRNCSLEWTESGRVLVPRWASIFQSLYQTRLLLLNSEPPPTVYIISKGDEEAERPLELDEVEQKIPFAKDIAAGSEFGRTRPVNLVFDDIEEQEARTTMQEKLALAMSYKSRFNFEERESATTLGRKQLPSADRTEKGIPFVVPENSWSILSPSLDSWQRGGQPVSLKKRRLALSPDSATQSLPADLSNSFKSTIWTESTSVSDIREADANGLSISEHGEGDQLSGQFEFPRLPEETELDSIVMKLNKDVDRALRRASSDMCFADTQFAAAAQAELPLVEHNHFRSGSSTFYNRPMLKREIGQIEPPAWSVSGDLPSLDQLLERCWKAQKNIDQKLEDSFGIIPTSLQSNS